MNAIQLRLANQSQGTPDVVVFQKNAVPSFDETAIAWRVLAADGSASFPFPLDLSVAASDSWGNFTPPLVAAPGQLFAVTTGLTLSLAGNAASPSEVQVANRLTQGAINASIYRDGHLLAIKTNVAPGQTAAFQFDPAIWIGVVSGVIEGSVMDSAIVQSINTQLSLLGITAADIIMTGGGPGTSAAPYVFQLANVVSA